MNDNHGYLVTILVPNYKTPQITKICMRLLRKHTDFTIARVIAIDNNSQDESLTYLKSLPWIELIERTPEADDTPPLSHSRALDLALSRVATPFVLSIHTDTFVKHPGWLDNLLSPFNEDNNIAGVGSWKLESKTWWQRGGRKLEELWKKALYRLTGHKTYQDIRFDPTLHYLRSHCAIYRTEVIRSLNTCFSDGDKVAGSIMHKKMVDAGYRMIFLPSEHLGKYVDHLNHATMVLNPELGSGKSTIRKGRRNIRRKLRDIDSEYLLNNQSLDI